MSAPQLRDYQIDVVRRIESETAAGRRRLCLVAPTGSGKTVIAAALIAKAADRSEHVLFMAHRRELIEQSSRKLHDTGVDHGIIQAGYPPRLGERVQIASIQTLHARAVRTCKIELPPANLLIIDECHHVRAVSYMRLVEAYPNAIALGLTATPCRMDGRGLGNVFQALSDTTRQKLEWRAVKRGRKIARKSEPAARRIIRRPEVKRRTGYSGTTIWRKEKEGTFPKHVQLSPEGMAVGWYEDEVDDWIRSRVREPGKRPPAAKRARPEEQDVGSKTVNAAHTGAVEPAKKTTKRAGAREASTSTRPTTPARGIAAAAAPKRGRDARSGHRAE